MAWHSVVRDLSVDESGVELAPPMDRSQSQPASAAGTAVSAAGTAVSLPSTVCPPKRARSPPAPRVKSPPPSGFRSPLATKSSAAQNSMNPSEPCLKPRTPIRATSPAGQPAFQPAAPAPVLPTTAQPTMARNMTVAGLLHDSKQETTASSVGRNYSYVPPNNSSAFALSPLQHGQCSLPPTTDAIAGRNRWDSSQRSFEDGLIWSSSCDCRALSR